MQLPIVFATVVTLAAGHPGLLKVPKVYNAVITSNQNLSPSRAFPVIQPVIHRTAVGYVPPIYYPQVAPEIPGPGLVHLSRNEPSPSNRAEVQAEGAAAAPVDLPVDVPVNLPVDAPVDAPVNTPADAPKVPEPKKVESSVENGQPKPGPRNRHDEQPLSFYPNYQSLYYDPYFYTYSGINPHLVPGTYYVDYQPYGTLDPIPASTPKNGDPGQLLPGYHEERKDPATADKPKVPDVPPPPLPTAAPKDS
ncbi:uncharacterized protein LOC117221603 [Megalopta genalis]|uniref:uncharacterized protein LOC117221603 n=1 Tax=Megalopta genalis TaxID=115081 RepID=UPI001442EA8E|nr:leucine-rich repeat extensin-like protein 1 [Megalopta genalis]